MLNLRRYSKYRELVKFDMKTGIYSQILESFVEKDIKTNGFYEFLGGSFIAIYVAGNVMYVAISGKSYPITDLSQISHVKYDSHVRSIFISSKKFKTQYLKYCVSIYEDNVICSVDPEDYDFGLFVSNIFNSHDRIAIFIDNNG